jgi:hypothetical protein
MKSFNAEDEAITHIEENGCGDFNGMNCGGLLVVKFIKELLCF